MAETIKGINIVIGAETTGLSAALADVTKKSRDIQSELRQVERLLKFDPGNTELLAQRQKLLADAVANTSDKLNRLKNAQQQVAEQFARGDISEGQYRAFQREVAKTEQELQRLQDRLQATEQEQQRIASSTKELETLFQATGKSVDDFAGELGVTLVNAIKNGRASADQLDTAITKIGQAALGVNVDLDKMRAALKSVDDGNSIANVRKELNALSKEAGDAKKSFKDMGVELENVVGAMAAGGGISGAIEKALDTSNLKTKIDITFDVPEESKKAVKDAVRTIEAYGIDSEAALEGVRRQWALNKNATDEANTAIVKGAAAIATAYDGIDFTELIQETNEISSELGVSKEQALGLVNALLKAGFPPEQLDIISEYGQQLKRAGYSAQEIQAIFKAGIDTGTWNIDNLLDGLKEGRIRLAEFGQGVPKATQELLQGTKISAQQLQAWGQAVAAGGERGKKAMLEVAMALNGVKDETTKNALGVAIFGTMWEDQGQNIIETILNAQSETANLQADQQNLNDTVSKLDSSPAVQLQKAFADLKTALEPLLGVIANIISAIAVWIQNNPTLAATITAVISVIGILIGIGMALAPIFTAIATAAGIMGVSVGAIAAPVAIVVAAIAGLIAIGVALWQNWDQISAFLQKIWNGIKDAATTVFGAVAVFFSNTWDGISTKVTTVWNTITSWLSGVWNGIKDAAITVFGPLADFFSNTWDGISTTVTTVWNTITSWLSGVWNGIKNTAVNVFNQVKNGIVGAFTSAKNLIQGVWNGIVGAIKGSINWVIGAINGFISRINNIKISVPAVNIPLVGKVGGFTVGLPKIPQIPKLETGTNYVPRDMLAFLHKGEAVVPKRYNPEAGGQAISQQRSYVQNAPLMQVQQLVVRNDNDISKISQELHSLNRSTLRALGVSR